jgi:tetratricopeptide (TPR) repeat protein
MSTEADPDLVVRATAAYGHVLAQPEASGPEVSQLLADARAAGHPEALVMALRAAASLERIRLAHGRAAVLLDEAARIARRCNMDGLLGQVLVARGVVNHELGKMAAAKRDFDRAAVLVAPAMAAELACQRAALQQNTGRLSEAAKLYRSVLSDPATPVDVRAKAANNLGIIEAQCGRYEQAFAWSNVAAEAAEQIGPAGVARAAQTRAWVTVQAGRLTDGMHLFDEAGRLLRAAGLPLGEFYAEYADALIDLRLIPEATERARRAVQMLEGHGVQLMAAEAQLRAARLAHLRGDLQLAVAAADSAADQLRRQGRASWAAQARLVAVDARLHEGEGRPGDLSTARRAAATLEHAGMTAGAVAAYLSAGRVAAVLDRPAAAVRAWTHAADLSRHAPVLVRLNGRLAAALAARLQQRHDEVIRHGRAGLDDLARHRAALASTELRALASGHGSELGRLGLASVAQTRSAAGVLEWMERTRVAALSLVDPAATAGVEDELGALRATYADILASRRQTGTEPAALLARQAAIENRIRRATWTRRSSAGTTGAGTSTAALRRLLDGHILIEYDVLDGDVLAAVLEPRRTRVVRLHPIDAVRRETGALLFALRRLAWRTRPSSPLAARQSADTALARLAEMLIKPLDLPTHPGLVVVPVGELQRIPWPAVHTEPVSVAPSASLWARSRLRQPPADGHVALVAGPDLPGAVNEIHSLRTLHDEPIVLVPPASRVDVVTRALQGAGLAHLACHGHIRADNPTFSSLLLSDGPLTVHELDQRGIAPYRLVLAACESGSDTTYEGNEMLGFVGTLIASGTAGLVASSVVVPDWDVVPLMHALHSAVRGGATLARALHSARATVDRQDPASFVSWCAFSAFGAA